jgi:hypothetical protein
LIPTLMPAMRPSGMDARTDSAYFGPLPAEIAGRNTEP